MLLLSVVVFVFFSTQFSLAIDDNPYKLLDVATGASESEIKKAYRAMAKAHHPDKHSPDEAEKFSKRFTRIASAYETLMDPRKRRIFDQTQHRKTGKPFNNQNNNNNNHHHNNPFRSGPRNPGGPSWGAPPRGHQQHHHHRPVPNPTIHNYYSARDNIMSNFENKGIWIIHLFTSTPDKCPLCSSFKNDFKQLAIKLTALGFNVGAMNCAKDMLKCRRHEALYNDGIPLHNSERQFVPSLSVVMRGEGETHSSFKVSGSPYVCMTNERCSGTTNKRLANAAGLYSSIFYKLLSRQVSSITQWSELRDFMTTTSAAPATATTPPPPTSGHEFGLLLWSARTEIDKTLVHQFIGVAHSFNVTLGTIRNARTTNKPFVQLFSLQSNTTDSAASADSTADPKTKTKTRRDMFPLLLVQCHTDDFLFTAHHPYTGSLTTPGSMDTVTAFLDEFISADRCRDIIQEARLQRENDARLAQATLESFIDKEKELRQRSVSQLRDLARDLFAGDLEATPSSSTSSTSSTSSGNGSGSDSGGVSRSALLGLGEVGDGGTRMTIDKSDIISALLGAGALLASSSSSAFEACDAGFS